jgi:hypothetical protein
MNIAVIVLESEHSPSFVSEGKIIVFIVAMTEG